MVKRDPSPAYSTMGTKSTSMDLRNLSQYRC
jgi:hypothetical protein